MGFLPGGLFQYDSDARGSFNRCHITPASEVAVYTYDDNGQLSFVRAVPDSGAGACWAIVNHAGSRLYATHTGDNSNRNDHPDESIVHTTPFLVEQWGPTPGARR
jgi:6-phosphogluconolactonase (cycloisomerase 2 family)